MLHAVKVILASILAFVFIAFVIICIDAGWALIFNDKYNAMYEIELIHQQIPNLLFFGGLFGFFIAVIMLLRGDW